MAGSTFSRIALALGTVVLASACAFGTRSVNLTYAPTLARAGAPPVYGRVAVARLQDARVKSEGTGNLLGRVRNMYGMPTASVRANQDPLLWVSEGVARSLLKQGFQVHRVESARDDPEIPLVTGVVNRASGRMYGSMDAHVIATLEVQLHGATVGMLKCAGQAQQGAGAVSAEEYRVVFEAAMTDFAVQCGPKLANILTGGAP